jgi:hypothetical protein
VKYLRPQILADEYDSDDAKVFLNWNGKPLGPGDLNKKVKKFFRRYGYDLSITRLREIIATHVEDSAQDLTNEGLFILLIGMYLIYVRISGSYRDLSDTFSQRSSKILCEEAKGIGGRLNYPHCLQENHPSLPRARESRGNNKV